MVTLEPEAFISGAWMGIYFLQGFIIPVVCSYLSVPLFCASGSKVSIYVLLLHIYLYISIFLILPPQIFSLIYVYIDFLHIFTCFFYIYVHLSYIYIF